MTRARRVRDPAPADKLEEPSVDQAMLADAVELPQFADDFAPGEPSFDGGLSESDTAALIEPASLIEPAALPEPAALSEPAPPPESGDPAFDLGDEPAVAIEPAVTADSVELPELEAFFGASDLDARPFMSTDADPPEPAPELMLLEALAADAVDLDQCVVFWAAGTRFVAPIGNVVQVGDVGRITFVPRVPVWIAGVVGWRDRVLSLIDMAALLDTPAGSADHRLVVVTNAHGDAAGLLVDRIGRIVRFDPTTLRTTPPPGSASVVSRATYGDDPAAAPAVLDVDLLFEAAWSGRSLASGAA